MNRILFLTLFSLLLPSWNSASVVRVRAQVEENEVDYPRDSNEKTDRELAGHEEYSSMDEEDEVDYPLEMNADEDRERELGDYDEEDEDDYPLEMNEVDRELGGGKGKGGGYYGGKKGGYYGGKKGGYYGGKKGGYYYGKGKGKGGSDYWHDYRERD